MKIFSKYPKFLLLIGTFILAYIIFSNRDISLINNTLLKLGYFGAFIAGILYTFSFTAAPATAILLIIAEEQNIVLNSLIAGLGALFGDLIIFKYIRFSLRDEINKISKEKFFKKIKISSNIKKYFIPVLSFIIIASPLPDEIGVSLLAISKKISTNLFLIISYISNTLGIFIILILGNS
ncbi:MAG: hypothetical protein V1663_00325 [archaeon]